MLKWKWVGIVSRIKDNRWSYKLTFCYLTQYGRKVGKQTTRCADELNNFLRNKMFHRIAKDRKEWDRLQETFAQKQGLG